MFLVELSSTDERFKTLRFHEGLNILVAERTDASEQGDSRNSVGKTSFIRILKYVLGGNLDKELKKPELVDHAFSAEFELPGAEGDDRVGVTRSVSPTTRLTVTGWSQLGSRSDVHVDEWRELLTSEVFKIDDGIARPTAGQMWGQLVRTYFDNPVKGHASEADWESGIKLGYMLGLDPKVLAPAGDLNRLAKQNKALRAAVKEGAMAHLSLDEPGLRAQLVNARRIRDRTLTSLREFRVDDQYADHQRGADEITGLIQQLNDEGLALARRQRELRDAFQSEDLSGDSNEPFTEKLGRVYAELGLMLPDAVVRRYDEVLAFHSSVIRNRRMFLEEEMTAVVTRLKATNLERRVLDDARSNVLALLHETVALDTFLNAQRDLAVMEAEVADIERRLEAAITVSSIGDNIKIGTAELVSAVRSELNVNRRQLEDSISLFGELGAEIYTDRQASLLISPTANGILRVEPHLSGDAGGGVRSVETFMLDMVCAISAMKLERAPRILVHDSHLFDAIDGRQVASCLNIGARLAAEHGFQYLVTMNSDFLENVQRQSDDAFDSTPYELSTRLTDAADDGGLFGFQFD